jgi:hypothetical protein
MEEIQAVGPEWSRTLGRLKREWMDIIKMDLNKQEGSTYSSVDIGTGYRLDGQGMIPSRGKMFLYSTASRSAPGSTQWVPVDLSSGIKRPGREADRLPPSSAEVLLSYTSTSTHAFMVWCLIN